jgi:ribosomal protein L11 methyltransferase
MDYIQISLDISPKKPWTEVITQELAEIDFESFTEEDQKLQAFINKENFKKEKLEQLIKTYAEKEVQIQTTKKLIPSKNWNAVWESDYQPVEVDNLLLIRAPFHPVDERFKLNIEIQPQMSFGTGHHQTTFLLSHALLDIDFKGKSVLDVGTGTGVLGILASKLGATNVFGTDIEEGAVENALENCGRNQITNFTIVKGDIEVVPKNNFDVIIANINKNVLLRHLSAYSILIKDNGLLLLSGFFETDIQSISDEAKSAGFCVNEIFTKEKWAVLKLQKTM